MKDNNKHKAYLKKHYAENKQYYIDKKNRRKREITEWVVSLKTGCSSCDENHIACLEFHHNDPNLKELSIRTAIGNGWGKERILQEIGKCTVLCVNCHRKKHHHAL